MKSPRFNSTLVSTLLASVLAIGMAASTQPALAQDEVLASHAKIPFAFQAGSKTMPAGTYVIKAMSDHVLLLRETNQNAAEFVMVHAAYTLKTPSQSTIVFDHRGNKYFLRRIWLADRNSGIETQKSREEKRLEVASADPAADTVTLALNAPPQR